jgi:xanthine dehydrogenase accessory factor
VISDWIRERQLEFEARREPFVTATVVKVQHPTSAAAGNVALVRADGALEGFVGGICAQQSVRVYSLKAIASGEPLLLRIIPDPDQPDPASAPIGEEQVIASDEGSVTVRNPCLSGGAIEVFLEPRLPAPRVLVAGDSPIASALQRLGPALDFEIAASRPVQPAAGDLALVVAAHGRDELEALRAGVEAGLPYVGLVASHTRGAAVLEELRQTGVDPAAVARIETPAGIDIGAFTPGEIALSILARVVAVHRRAKRSGADAGLPRGDLGGHVAAMVGPPGYVTPASAVPPPAPQTAVDPTCGMTVVIDADTPRAERNGESFYFCSDGCRRAFE